MLQHFIQHAKSKDSFFFFFLTIQMNKTNIKVNFNEGLDKNSSVMASALDLSDVME